MRGGESINVKRLIHQRHVSVHHVPPEKQTINRVE